MSSDKGKAFDFKLLGRLFKYTSPYKFIFVLVAIAAILLSALAVYRAVLIGNIVDEAIKVADMDLLIYYVLLTLAVLMGEVIFQLNFNYFANWLGQSVIRDIRIRLFKHMNSFKMSYFDNSSLGVLVTRAVADMERIGEIFSNGFFMIVADLLKMIVVAVIMVVLNWKLSLIVFAVLPLLLYATRLFQRAMKTAFIEVRAQVANLNSFVQERIAGMKLVQLFNREKEELKTFNEINTLHRDAWIKTVWYNSLFFPVAEIVSSVTIGLIVWYGGMKNLSGELETDFGTIFTFILLSEMLFRPLRQIADKFLTMQVGMVVAGRVFRILDSHYEVESNGSVKLHPVKGAIEFKNLYFGHIPEEEVLKGISFNIKAGETVAIVGATGAGKSTVINLLNRFYKVEDGSIFIDGVDINEFELNSLRSNIAVVLQDVFLFADTIQNNISLKDDSISLEQIERAAKEIGVHEFFMKLPGGYGFNVKERGGMLSSGQRQLLAFLRAYVTKPSILILDEATSSIDSYSEQLIQEATLKITKGRTSIVIAHRLATIQNADVIIVMEKGKIVESGTHGELLDQAGYYKKLYEAQFLEEDLVDE